MAAPPPPASQTNPAVSAGVAAQRTGGLLKPSGDRPIGVTPPSGNGNRVDNTRPLLQPFNGNVYNSHSSSSKRPPPGADLGPSQGSFQSSFQEYPQGSYPGSFQGSAQGPPSSQGQGHSFQFQSTGTSGSGGVTKTPSGVDVGGSKDKSPPVAGFTNAAQGASSGGRPPQEAPRRGAARRAALRLRPRLVLGRRRKPAQERQQGGGQPEPGGLRRRLRAGRQGQGQRGGAGGFGPQQGRRREALEPLVARQERRKQTNISLDDDGVAPAARLARHSPLAGSEAARGSRSRTQKTVIREQGDRCSRSARNKRQNTSHCFLPTFTTHCHC
nr:uncharacterized protein LOC113811488 [Penaeus vannamei]